MRHSRCAMIPRTKFSPKATINNPKISWSACASKKERVFAERITGANPNDGEPTVRIYRVPSAPVGMGKSPPSSAVSCCMFLPSCGTNHTVVSMGTAWRTRRARSNKGFGVSGVTNCSCSGMRIHSTLMSFIAFHVIPGMNSTVYLVP